DRSGRSDLPASAGRAAPRVRGRAMSGDADDVAAKRMSRLLEIANRRIETGPSVTPAPAPASGPILEREQRLSRSCLWTLQRGFFERHGPEAWSEGIVPHHVTSNPWIGRAYARVVLGWMRDWARAAGAAPAPIDPREPVYLVELGSGSGRFAHHFARSF